MCSWPNSGSRATSWPGFRSTDVGLHHRRPSRRVKDVTYAAPCLRPAWLPKAKAGRGAKALGLRYENLLAKALKGRATHGQWFHFIADGEPGWCQPDLLIVGKRQVLVLEVKLTYTPMAESQLADLYLPVVERAYGRPARGLIVAKNLTPEAPPQVFESIADAVTAGAPLGLVHWLGRGAP